MLPLSPTEPRGASTIELIMVHYTVFCLCSSQTIHLLRAGIMTFHLSISTVFFPLSISTVEESRHSINICAVNKNELVLFPEILLYQIARFSLFPFLLSSPTCILINTFNLQSPPVFNNKCGLHFDFLYLIFLT